jgi:hypothetical protein
MFKIGIVFKLGRYLAFHWHTRLWPLLYTLCLLSLGTWYVIVRVVCSCKKVVVLYCRQDSVYIICRLNNAYSAWNKEGAKLGRFLLIRIEWPGMCYHGSLTIFQYILQSNFAGLRESGTWLRKYVSNKILNRKLPDIHISKLLTHSALDNELAPIQTVMIYISSWRNDGNACHVDTNFGSTQAC